MNSGGGGQRGDLRHWLAFFLGGVVAVAGTGLLLMRGQKELLLAVMALLMEPVVVCVVARHCHPCAPPVRLRAL